MRTWFRGDDQGTWKDSSNGIRISVDNERFYIQSKVRGEWLTEYGVGTEHLQELQQLIVDVLQQRANTT